MLNPEKQSDALREVEEKARAYGLLVAPVGSVYFLFRGAPTLRTKDIDAVLHTEGLEPASLEQLRAVGQALGTSTVGHDGSTVKVEIESVITDDGHAEADLIRGSERPRFIPRSLLREAARRGRIEGAILWYPIEYVVVLKADAAIDRRLRARIENEYTQENRVRERAFTADVIVQVQDALSKDGLREDYLQDAVDHLKESRRGDAARLIEMASGGRLRVLQERS